MAPNQPLLLGIDIYTATKSQVIDQDAASGRAQGGIRLSPVGPSKMQTSGGRRLHDSPCLCRPARGHAPSPPLQSTPSRRSCPSIATVQPERLGSVARSADSTASGAATRATR